MSPITTHVLDLAAGSPARGMAVALAFQVDGGGWEDLAASATDLDGRARDLIPEGTPLRPGTYRLTFQALDYFQESGRACFYPSVVVHFLVADPSEHHHVPLLLSPFGYSTYRGS